MGRWLRSPSPTLHEPPSRQRSEVSAVAPESDSPEPDPSHADDAPARNFDVVTAGAATTNRDPSESQDRWGKATLVNGRGRAVVVCDGVGSQPESGAVAASAVAAAVDVLSSSDPDTATAHVVRVVERAAHDGPSLDGNTTMLVAAAHDVGQIDIAYVGNGAILEVAGIEVAADRMLLRWVNHTLPHVDPHHALTTYIGPDAPGAVPYLVSIVLPPRQTRLFLLCTDGVYTGEESPAGRTPDGAVWQSVPQQLDAVLSAIEATWSALATEPIERVPALLTSALECALDQLREDGQLEDDATAAAVFLRPVTPTER